MALQTVEGTKLDQQFKGYMLPPDVIEVDPALNPRDMESAETQAHIAELQASLHARGWDADEPMIVRRKGAKFVPTNARCRLK